MEVHQEGKGEPKENALSSSAFLEKGEDQDNYVFIDEKYKKYFDNISDIFEDKVEYVLNKHFKKNDPTNKNKLLCLNLCVLWQKKFLLLLSKTLNEYEEFKQKHNLKNDKGKNEGEINEKKKETVLKEKDSKQDNNITDKTTVTNVNATATNKTSTTNDTSSNNNNNNNEITTISTDTITSTSVSAEKDLKSFIKNVKIIDSKNIEVVYDPSEINDNRPSAELSTEEIYYLLVESKKSENEYKKKIFTFLQYLPLIIQSMETKNYLEKKNLEHKLLFTEYNDMNNYQHTGQNKRDTHLNNQNIDMDMENPNHANGNVMNMNMNNGNDINNMNNINNMNHMNGIDNFGMQMNNVPNNPVSGNEDENININATDGFHLSEEEITNKLNAIVKFNYSLSENLEKLFKYELNNKKKYKRDNKDLSNNNENENNDDDDNNNNNNDNNINNNNDNNNNNINNRNKLFRNPIKNTEHKNIMLSSNANCQNEDENTHNLKSLVLPLSRVNDLSMINNISAKTNNITYEDVNENENEYLFYIYKNNMDKTNLYGLDILTNLNNKVLCKINHIYSLVQFYTMLAKDLFDDA